MLWADENNNHMLITGTLTDDAQKKCRSLIILTLFSPQTLKVVIWNLIQLLSSHPQVSDAKKTKTKYFFQGPPIPAVCAVG